MSASVYFPHPAVCVLRIPRTYRAQHLREIIADLFEQHDGATPFGVIADLRDVVSTKTGTEVRQESSQLVGNVKARLAPHLICEARLCTSTILRAAVTVYDWMTPVPWDRNTFSNTEMAENWLRAKLAHLDIDLPDVSLFEPARESL